MDFTLLLGRWAEPILTRDPAQRLRLAMCVNAGVYYVAYCILLLVQVRLGFAAPRPTYLLVAAELTAAATVYAVIRSGANLRVKGDPSLTRLQLAVGFVFTLLAYALVGPGASAILIVVASQVVYTMFSLPPRQVHAMVAITLVALAATMVACHHFDPLRYPADVQVMAFLYALLVYPLIASLATRVTSMSEKLRANRRQLQEALAQVKELATRDDLTRIHNRRHMTELMDIEQRQHQRAGNVMCLALLDIDLFKSVNDHHGHKAGDQVLQRFAALAQQALRSADLVSRWGGEEFMVLFAQTGPDEAMRALQRLQELLAATSFDDIAAGLKVSFSGGLAQVNPGDALAPAIERADQAMYQAKTAGRCRSCIG